MRLTLSARTWFVVLLDVGVALVVVLPLAVGLGVAGVAVVQQVTVGRVVRLALVLGRDRLPTERTEG